MATLLRNGIKDSGYTFLIYSPSNQLFPIFPNKIIARLEKEYLFYIWKQVDNHHSALRLVTSWATEKDKVLRFVKR